MSPAGHITPSDMRLRIYTTAYLHRVIYKFRLKAEKAATCSDIQNMKEHQRNLVN